MADSDLRREIGLLVLATIKGAKGELSPTLISQMVEAIVEVCNERGVKCVVVPDQK